MCGWSAQRGWPTNKEHWHRAGAKIRPRPDDDKSSSVPWAPAPCSIARRSTTSTRASRPTWSRSCGPSRTRARCQGDRRAGLEPRGVARRQGLPRRGAERRDGARRLGARLEVAVLARDALVESSTRCRTSAASASKRRAARAGSRRSASCPSARPTWRRVQSGPRWSRTRTVRAELGLDKDVDAATRAKLGAQGAPFFHAGSQDPPPCKYPQHNLRQHAPSCRPVRDRSVGDGRVDFSMRRQSSTASFSSSRDR